MTKMKAIHDSFEKGRVLRFGVITHENFVLCVSLRTKLDKVRRDVVP
jgi:hypothetical protein